MENLELSFASKESSLSVRSFRVEQRMSEPFEVHIVARSKHEDVDLDALVGEGATFRMGSEGSGGAYRVWTGICSHAEQVEVEPDGLSTYHLRIVPALWRTTRRKNSRIFQHLSLPEIAIAVLADWQIVPVLKLELGRYPRFEYRVQYGETDYAFLHRVLEEAGISYYFRDPLAAPEGQAPAQSELVLSAEPDGNEARLGGPVPFVNRKDSTPSGEFVSHVRLVHEARAGKFTVRDYDFRSRPDLELFAEAESTHRLESKLEIYDYLPGAFVVEQGDGGPAHVDEREARAFAERQLAAVRQGRRAVELATSCFDLQPGVVFSITDHPRRDIDDKRILVVRETITGTHEGKWEAHCRGVFADEAYRPLLVTPKPRIHGVQSALVVGPSGQEIHTDDFGRVRVQFHWDREGQRDHKSSCFIRVSQAWAGRGYGVQSVPRVGDEVLVGFFEGDPDQPVVVGRVHNSASRVPHNLPISKTKTSWKSESSPGGGGWNEISLEDAKGQEQLFLHAEKDLSCVVKNDSTKTVGASLSVTVGAQETRQIKADHTLKVGGNRAAHIEGSDTISVAKEFSLKLGDSGTGVAVTADKRIVLSTGEASIVLDGPNIYFDGQASIRMSAGQLFSLSGQEMHLDGQPNLFLNSLGATPPGVAPLMSALSHAANLVEETVEERSLTKLLTSPVEAPGAAPEALALPAHIEQQLVAARDKILTGVEQIEAEVKDKAQLLEDAIKGKLGELKENLVPKVEAARAELNARIDQMRALVEKVKGEAAAFVGELKARAAALKSEIEARIQAAKDLVESVKERIRATVDQVKERIEQVKAQAREIIANIKQRITDIKDQIKKTFDDLRTRAIAVVKGEVEQVKALITNVRDQIKGVITQVKTTIDEAKAQVQQLVTNVKNEIQAVKDQVHKIIADVKGEIQAVKDEVKQTIQGVKDEVKGAVNQAKAEWSNLKAEGKAIVKDAKAEWNDIKGQGKQIADEAKSEWKDIKSQGKQIADEAKSEWKDIKGQAQQTAQDVKQTAQQAAQDAKQAAQDVKQTAQQTAQDVKQAAQQTAQDAKQAGQELKQAGQDLKGAANDALGKGSPVQFSHQIPGGMSGGLPGAGPSPLHDLPIKPPPSGIVARPGGFGGDAVARAVNAHPGATYLQSPTDGQLMIVRTQMAQHLSPEQLTAGMVDHQMNGMTTADAMTTMLREHGYVVYERPWDQLSGLFVQKAAL